MPRLTNKGATLTGSQIQAIRDDLGITDDVSSLEAQIGEVEGSPEELSQASPEPHVFLYPKRTILASSTCSLNSNIDIGGGTDDTVALQALLDQGGDEDSHLEVVLDGVALISDTLKMSSYTRLSIPANCGIYLNDASHCHMITGPNDGLSTIVKDVQIWGPGTLNGNDANQSKWLGADNQELPSGPWDRVVGWVYGIWFSGFDGLNIKDLTLRNVKTFNYVMAHGERFRIENCRSEYDVVNHAIFQNRDSCHMFSPLRHGLIRNHWSNGDDDVIAFNTDEDAALSGQPEDLVRGDAGDGGTVDVFVDGVTTVEGVNGVRFFGDSGSGWLDKIRVKDFTGDLVFGGMQCAPPTILTRTYNGLFSAGDTGLKFIGRIEIDNYNVTAVAGYEADVYTDIIVDSAEELVLRNVPNGVILRTTSGNAQNSPTGSGTAGVASVTMPGSEYPIWEGGGAVTVVSTGSGTPSSGWWRMTTGATAGSSALWRPTSNVFTRFGRGASDAGVNWDFPVTFAWKSGFQLTSGASLRLQLGRTTADTTIANLSGSGIGVLFSNGNISLEAHNGTTRVTSGTLDTYVVGSFTFNAIRVRSWRGKVELWVNDVFVGSILGGPVVASADSAAGVHISVENGADASASFVDAIPGFLKVFVEA